MAQLFNKDRTVIVRHIRNAIADGEIDAKNMCAKFAHMGKDADQTYWTEVYNLDVIISVGCRFKVYSGKVEIGKMPEKYDQVHILNSSSRRKQQ
jgi:hypothetical protein